MASSVSRTNAADVPSSTLSSVKIVTPGGKQPNTQLSTSLAQPNIIPVSNLVLVSAANIQNHVNVLTSTKSAGNNDLTTYGKIQEVGVTIPRMKTVQIIKGNKKDATNAVLTETSCLLTPTVPVFKPRVPNPQAKNDTKAIIAKLKAQTNS